jgi:hypothetical protein
VDNRPAARKIAVAGRLGTFGRLVTEVTEG